MDLKMFEGMEAAELRQYLHFLMRHYRQMDSFWYLYVTEMFDEPTADRLNEKVWDRVAGLGARDLIQRFGIKDRGLRGFVRALRYWPWHLIAGFQIEEKPDEVIITVPSCPSQEARLQHGLNEYHCKEMHRREFGSFAKEIDARIQTECIFAPPDEHPEGMFCK